MENRLIAESRSPANDLYIIDFDRDRSFVTEETRSSTTTSVCLTNGIAVTHNITQLLTSDKSAGENLCFAAPC